MILNFAAANEIGQAFAGEVFQVFLAAHPQVVMAPVNTTTDIDNMVKRAWARGRDTA